MNDMHKRITMNRNYRFEQTAEGYLSNYITTSRPELKVKHIMFDTKGIGGIQTYYYSLRRLCEKHNANIRFSESSTQNYYKNQIADGGDYSFGFTYHWASAMSKLYEIIAAEDFDLIHAHDFITAYYAVKMEIPVVFTSHSLESAEMEHLEHTGEEPFEKELPSLEKNYYAYISTIITLSESYKDSLPRPAKVMTAPFILPESKVPPIDLPVPIAKQNPKAFDPNVFTIAFFGRATHRKGIDRFIEALDALGNRDYQILFVGPYVDSDVQEILSVEMEKSTYLDYMGEKVKRIFHVDFSMKTYVLHFEIESDVINEKVLSEEFDRHLKRIWAAYQFADVVVVPSRYESFGYVALEAMACRRLVIASEAGGLKETLSQERGILVNNDNTIISALTKKLLWVMDNSNKDKIEEIRENGYQYVRDEYTNKSTAKLVDEMYGLYLSSIMNGNLPLDYKRLKYGEMKINAERELSGKNEWREIVMTAAHQYRVFRKSNFPDAPKELELYDLFWELAR